LGISTKKVSGSIGNIKDYLLYVPDTYNSNKTKKWPLVIFLHGIGEIGTNVNELKNVGLPKVVKGKQFVMLAPQCTANWWNSDVLQKFLNQVKTLYNIDINRIYLTGLSMGGYGAWDWSEHQPTQFAAVVPICGGGTTSLACSLKNKPVWAFHNANDPTVNVKNSRDMVKAIKACGGKLIKYTENSTGGHDAWTKAYANSALYTWMLAQKK
jgi:predicted peptidase